LFSALLSLSPAGPWAQAGHFEFNFDFDPSEILELAGTAAWRPFGGNPAEGGYLSITDAVNEQLGTILFAETDPGQVLSAFSFSLDVRVGNPVGCADRPGYGFSMNFVRDGDPVLTGRTTGFAGTLNEPGAQDGGGGLPEEGCTTGLGVGLDTWSSGPLGPRVAPGAPGGTDDVEGLSIRVDNTILFQLPLPTRNGSCEDLTSVQTGPTDSTGSTDPLCWQRFEVNLTPDAELTVKYKGQTILDNFQTTFGPSRGRFVFSGRTGGCNENHHIDNVVIDTTPFDQTPPVISCPSDLTHPTGQGQCSAVATFTATASDNHSGVTVACIPPSGSTFAVGTSTVTCTATDAADNTDTCSFTVTVVAQPPLLLPIGDEVVHAGTVVNLALSVSNLVGRPESLSYSLGPGAPPEASINPTNGFFSWATTAEDVGTTRDFTVRVTDQCSGLSDTKTFSITVESRPVIVEFRPAGNSFQITWTSIAGKRYRVLYKPDLNERRWTALTGDIVASGKRTSTVGHFKKPNPNGFAVVLTSEECRCQLSIIPFQHCKRPIDDLGGSGTSECGGFVRGLRIEDFPDPAGIIDPTTAAECRAERAEQRRKVSEAGEDPDAGEDRLWILFKLEEPAIIPRNATLSVVMDVFALPHPGCSGDPEPIPGLQGISVPPMIVDSAVPPRLRASVYVCPSPLHYVAEVELVSLADKLAFDFCNLGYRRIRVRLTLYCNEIPLGSDEMDADVFDLQQAFTFYEILTEQLVRRDATAQGISVEHHPWYPVLVIGKQKALNYTLLLQRDWSLQTKNFGDPCWLMRVGTYLEYLTGFGVYEAVRDVDGFDRILSDQQQRCFLEGCQFSFARSVAFGPGNSRGSPWEPPASRFWWALGWGLTHGAEVVPFFSSPEKSKVWAVENVQAKAAAIGAFLLRHHEDLREAIKLSGSNMECFTRTWQRIHPNAQEAMKCEL
jgi:hypothetical protein